MSKKLYQLLFSIILLFSLASPVFAEDVSQEYSVNSESFKKANQEYNESKIAVFEEEVESIKSKIEEFPDDVLLQEAYQYLGSSPELSENSSIGYYDVNVVLFNEAGNTISLEDYVNEKVVEKSK
ncbi:hypothetical protein PAECIP111892_01054 [Paenibacillus auburnensis]|uniref:PepSY domain-containing protein n=1 Tax=Paenibacillus auburnensis TaxID=2905649 RepID=A0ABN8FUM5_9BACL|nr:hypothetical protein [Paenibacillus auburnensis]CAH1192635.1 hypothetical protein PAECIP111892_01054 [Paenibacillus auburnensis]